MSPSSTLQQDGTWYPADFQAAPVPPVDVLQSVRTGKVVPLLSPEERVLGSDNNRKNSIITSGIEKSPRTGRIPLTSKGLGNDERVYPPHRSPDNALHQYDARHYVKWRARLPALSPDLFVVGGFGENLTTAVLSEENVCVGDVFRIAPPGSANEEAVLVQATMPRQPCYKLNTRFGYRKMSAMAQRTGNTGWYYRLLSGGTLGSIAAGDEMILMRRPNPAWPLRRIQQHLYKDKENLAAMHEIVALEGLSAEFTTLFQKRLSDGGRAEDMTGRLRGDGDGAVPGTRWLQYKIVEKEELTPRIKKFVLSAVDQKIEYDDKENGGGEGSLFPRFPHVRLQFGPKPDATNRFTRAYSVVSGTPGRFELGIARDDNSRGGSRFLHDESEVGDILNVARGHVAPASGGHKGDETNPESGHRPRRHIFILGGIGITAFLTEIRALVSSPSSSCDTVEIHYAIRSLAEAPYLSLLPSPARDDDDDDDPNTNATTTTIFLLHLYPKSENKRLDVPSVIPSPPSPPSPHEKTTTPIPHIYACGPSSLLSAVRDRTEKLQYPAHTVHLEDFGGSSGSSSNETTTRGNRRKGPRFEAQIRSTGRVVEISPQETLLQALNKVGLEIESSCEVGSCGVCMVDYYPPPTTCGGEKEKEKEKKKKKKNKGGKEEKKDEEEEDDEDDEELAGLQPGEVLHRGVALGEGQKSEYMLSCVSRGKGRIVIDI